jgi:UDP-MurNAc hydroxylase
MAESISKRIKNEFPKVDLLMTGYSGAGAYPQCFENLDKNQKITEGNKKKEKFLNNALNFINIFNPDYVIPFAGQYELSGKLSKLNEIRGVPNLIEAKTFLNKKSNSECKLPIFEAQFLIENLKNTKEINMDFYNHKQKYIEKLSNMKLDYEVETDESDITLIKELIPSAYSNFEKKRKEFKFSTETQLYIRLEKDYYLQINFNGKPCSFEKQIDAKIKKYIVLKLDLRLLKLILMGPRFAHWNNAEIGSHISFYRKPDSLYERGMHFCMNFFHN